MRQVICPDCGSLMVLKWSGKWNKNQYCCQRWPACHSTHAANADGSLQGVPADAATRAARIESHIKLDVLWQTECMKRPNAYRLLAKLMDLPIEQAHISRFNLADCQRFQAQIAIWHTGEPSMRFYHLFMRDLRRILAEGSEQYTPDEVQVELARRIACAHSRWP